MVDDEPDILMLIKDLFEIFKFDVKISDNLKSARQILKSENIDIVVTDIRMGEDSGVDFLKEIKAHDAFSPKVFLISGFQDFPLHEIYNIGADGIFLKPFEASTLRKSVQSATQTEKEKWSFQNVKYTASKKIKNIYSNFSEMKNDIHFGRGGFCVKWQKGNLSVDDLIDFDFGIVKGLGKVIWSLEKNSIYGVEIIQINSDCIDPFIDWLDEKNYRAYIPNEV